MGEERSIGNFLSIWTLVTILLRYSLHSSSNSVKRGESVYKEKEELGFCEWNTSAKRGSVPVGPKGK